MTSRDAYKLVKRVAVTTMRHDITNGSEWIWRREDGELRNDADVERIKQAIAKFCAWVEGVGQVDAAPGERG